MKVARDRRQEDGGRAEISPQPEPDGRHPTAGGVGGGFVRPYTQVDEKIFFAAASLWQVPLDRRDLGLVGALIAALGIQIPMFPGTGLESRDPTTFAPWFQIVSMLLFPTLMVMAAVALGVAWRRPRVSAYLSVAFATGMIAVTLMDVTGLGGSRPPTAIAGLELGALITLSLTLGFALRVLRHRAPGWTGSTAGPPSATT